MELTEHTAQLYNIVSTEFWYVQDTESSFPLQPSCQCRNKSRFIPSPPHPECQQAFWRFCTGLALDLFSRGLWDIRDSYNCKHLFKDSSISVGEPLYPSTSPNPVLKSGFTLLHWASTGTIFRNLLICGHHQRVLWSNRGISGSLKSESRQRKHLRRLLLVLHGLAKSVPGSISRFAYLGVSCCQVISNASLCRLHLLILVATSSKDISNLPCHSITVLGKYNCCEGDLWTTFT